MMTCRLTALAILAAVLGGCATYTTPGGAVSIPEMTEDDVASILAREPAAEFPAHVVLARVQAPEYRSYTARGHGRGRFSVVTTQDIETEEDYERLENLEGVAGLGRINRVLISGNLNTTEQLRQAAAQLRGDIILLYTLDTAFHTETRQVGPLQAVSLGFFPNRRAHVTTTCSAAFIDVRTGYIYGLAEANAREEQGSTLWGSRAAIESARLRAEHEAFRKVLDEIETAWASIHAEYAGNSESTH